jgi:hypothetical protein
MNTKLSMKLYGYALYSTRVKNVSLLVLFVLHKVRSVLGYVVIFYKTYFVSPPHIASNFQPEEVVWCNFSHNFTYNKY